jgi:hypothetical protein
VAAWPCVCSCVLVLAWGCGPSTGRMMLIVRLASRVSAPSYRGRRRLDYRGALVVGFETAYEVRLLRAARSGRSPAPRVREQRAGW